MAAIKFIKRTVSLDGNSISEQLPASFFNGENTAHTFIIAAMRGGEAVTFPSNAGVSGTFLNANDAVVMVTGSVVDGAAVLTLSNNCYALTGRFTLTIDVNGATVYECQSRIKRRSSSTAYDPTGEISVAAIAAEIAAMRAATTAANTAATAANAATAAANNVNADISVIGGSARIEITDRNGTTKNVDVPDMSVPVAGIQAEISAEEARAMAEEARLEQLFTAPTQEAIDNWLNEHPEATTTVQDGSITPGKLAPALRDTYGEATIAFLHQQDSLCDTPANGFGSATVIHNDDACIIYDFGADTAQRVNAYLLSAGIHAVNAVIISHFHSDHATVAAVTAFVTACETNNISLANCTFYLPHVNIDWEQYVGTFKATAQSAESGIVSLLENKNIPYVYPSTEGQSVTVGGIKIAFYNVDSSYYANYYSWYYNEGNEDKAETNYNNFAMVAMLGIGSSNVLLSGDIMHPAQDAMAKLAKQADLIMVPHHGLNARESRDFVQNLNCRFAVLPAYWPGRFQSINVSLKPIAARCAEIGTLFTTLEDDVIIEITLAGMRPKDERLHGYRGEASGQKLYPGESLNDVGLGTFYVDRAAEAALILNWPEASGVKLGACKIESTPSASGIGVIQTAREIYMSRMYAASRKFENNAWSAWQLDKPMGGLDALSVADDVIPNNSDFNDYYMPGVSRVPSDASAATMSNCPYAASGKLIRLARTTAASNGYTMQMYIPSSSAQHIYTRNYNAGNFTDWKEFGLYETGTWTPHIYDNETKVLETTAQNYYKIGGLCFATFNITLSSALTISNVLLFRNLPFTFCWGGSFWCNAWGVGDEKDVRTVQPLSGSAVFRPNIKETFASGRTISGILIGI